MGSEMCIRDSSSAESVAGVVVVVAEDAAGTGTIFTWPIAECGASKLARQNRIRIRISVSEGISLIVVTVDARCHFPIRWGKPLHLNSGELPGSDDPPKHHLFVTASQRSLAKAVLRRVNFPEDHQNPNYCHRFEAVLPKR